MLIPYSYPTISAQILILPLSVSRQVNPARRCDPIRGNISLRDDTHIYFPAVPPFDQGHVYPVFSSGFQGFGRRVIWELSVLVSLLPRDDSVQT